MSATETETPATPSDPPATVSTEAELSEWSQDGSKVADFSALTTVRDEYAKLIKSIRPKLLSLTKLYKEAARMRMEIRSLILKKDGTPDWDGATDAYRLTIAEAEAEAWKGYSAAEKRQADGAIRQHVTRTYRQPAIERWVKAHGNFPTVSLNEADDGTVTVVVEDGKPVPAAFRNAVAKQYKDAGLKVPEVYGGTAPADDVGGNPPSDPDNPAAAFTQAVESLATAGTAGIAPLFQTLGLWRLTTEVTEGIHAAAAGEIPDRQKVSEVLTMIHERVGLTLKAMDGRSVVKDAETFAAAAYTPEAREKIEA